MECRTEWECRSQVLEFGSVTLGVLQWKGNCIQSALFFRLTLGARYLGIFGAFMKDGLRAGVLYMTARKDGGASKAGVFSEATGIF